MSQDQQFTRSFERVPARSIIVSLTVSEEQEPISGFLRDISEGGMKIQKIAIDREVPLGKYHCECILTGFGKIQAEAEVVGFGVDEDKFARHIVRLKFTEIDPESKTKVQQFVEKIKYGN